MPNWCSNRLTIEAKSDKDAEILISAFKLGDRDFSFNAIIPRPKELNILQGSVTSLAKEYLLETSIADPKLLERINKRWRSKTKLVHCDDPFSDDIRFGEGYEAFLKYVKAVAENISKFGHPNWFGWSMENWGVKWDASSSKLTQKGKVLIFEFETAWAPPVPVFEYIAEHFADHIDGMTVNCVEEGCECYLNERYI